MGQYYIPVNLSKKEWLSPWGDYKIGFKLMEHSWLQNKFVSVIEYLLSTEGNWYKDRIVWAGDYMDKGLFIHDINPNYSRYTNKILYFFIQDHGIKIKPEQENKDCRYIINHTKKEYVDKQKSPVSIIHDNVVYRIHPLPLLVCSGNGRGGGDYFSDAGYVYVGKWAGDSISIEKNYNSNYQEIIPNFKEEDKNITFF